MGLRGHGSLHAEDLGLQGRTLVLVAQTPGSAAPAQECTLLPGMFGVFMQAVLFVVCCSVLVFKKNLEEKRGDTRTWPAFLLDSSKQLVGAFTIHVLNLFFASALGGYRSEDACNWYFINIAVDCTVGVGIEYLLLGFLTYSVLPLFLKQEELADFETGNYGHAQRPDMGRYTKQLLLWVMVVVLMKLVMVGFMLVFASPLQGISSLLLAPVTGNSQAKLFVVMILTPLFFNALQFWLVDGFLKKQNGGGEGESTYLRSPENAREVDQTTKKIGASGEAGRRPAE